MKKVYIFILSSFLIFAPVNAISFDLSSVSKDVISDYEKQIENFFNKSKFTDERKFYLYMLGARNAAKYKELHFYSQKYYEKALKLKVDDKKLLRAQLEVGWFYRRSNLLNKLSSLVNESFNNYNKLKKTRANLDFKKIELNLNYFKVISSSQSVSDSINKDYSYFFGSKYDFEIVHHEMQTHMKNNNFDKALDLLKSEEISSKYYFDTVLSFDLLKIIKNKNINKLVCTESLKNLKVNGIGPLEKVCNHLEQIRSKGLVFNKKQWSRLVSMIRNDSSVNYMSSSLEKVGEIL